MTVKSSQYYICWVCDIYKYSEYHISYIQYVYGDKEVNIDMGCGCYGSGYQRARSFLTKEERITMLKEYQDELDKEKQGISERIKELEAS
jgi:hypothetical protein